MKIYEGVNEQFHAFLTLVMGGSHSVASCLSRCTHRNKAFVANKVKAEWAPERVWFDNKSYTTIRYGGDITLK